nr:MAG TPA: hypothetical protein [Caudoviricetes sp.]
MFSNYSPPKRIILIKFPIVNKKCSNSAQLVDNRELSIYH